MARSNDTTDGGEIEDNLLGINDWNIINEEEAKGVINAENFLLELEEDVIIDPALIKRIHFEAFGHLYEWAGKFRTVNVSVGSFIPPDYKELNNLMAQFTSQLNYYLNQANSLLDLVDAIAYAHHKIVAIHPFKNGNGRTARLISDLIAYMNGYDAIQIYNRNDNKVRELYIYALKKADNFDYQPLKDIISNQLIK